MRHRWVVDEGLGNHDEMIMDVMSMRLRMNEGGIWRCQIDMGELRPDVN